MVLGWRVTNIFICRTFKCNDFKVFFQVKVTIAFSNQLYYILFGKYKTGPIIISESWSKRNQHAWTFSKNNKKLISLVANYPYISFLFLFSLFMRKESDYYQGLINLLYFYTYLPKISKNPNHEKHLKTFIYFNN